MHDCPLCRRCASVIKHNTAMTSNFSFSHFSAVNFSHNTWKCIHRQMWIVAQLDNMFHISHFYCISFTSCLWLCRKWSFSLTSRTHWWKGQETEEGQGAGVPNSAGRVLVCPQVLECWGCGRIPTEQWVLGVHGDIWWSRSRWEIPAAVEGETLDGQLWDEARSNAEVTWVHLQTLAPTLMLAQGRREWEGVCVWSKMGKSDWCWIALWSSSSLSFLSVTDIFYFLSQLVMYVIHAICVWIVCWSLLAIPDCLCVCVYAWYRGILILVCTDEAFCWERLLASNCYVCAHFLCNYGQSGGCSVIEITWSVIDRSSKHGRLHSLQFSYRIILLYYSSPWRRSEYSDRNVGKTNLSFTRWNQRTQPFSWLRHWRSPRLIIL